MHSEKACGCISYDNRLVYRCLNHAKGKSMTIKARVGHDSDTCGYEWTIGEVYGVRSWNRDSLGRLVSPQRSYVWRPGENIADDATRHGFYAYTDTPSYKGDVKGIIKGYGKTTEGTRGFQCEKAEIVALVDGTKPVKHNKLRDFAAKRVANSRTHDLGALALWLFLVTVALGGGLFILSVVVHNWWMFALPMAGWSAVLGVTWYAYSPFGWGASGDTTGHSWKKAKRYLNKTPRTLRELYPNARFYDTVEDMLEDSRISKADITPDNPAFWDMPA